MPSGDREAWDAGFSFDENWTITRWNAGAERLLGWRAEEAIGGLIWDVVPGDGDRFARMAALLRGDWEGVLVVAAKDGRHVAIEARALAERDRRSGRILGWSTRLRELPPPPGYPEGGDPSLG